VEKNKMAKRLNCLVEVTWLDAVSGEHKPTLESDDVEDYLMLRKSNGRIHLYDDVGIVLINTQDAKAIEYTAIPKGMIKKVRYYHDN
jgi:hypothetical protein